MAHIYCFGDSITYGAFDLSVSGWVSRLRIYLDSNRFKDPKFKGLVYNMGVPGETTNGLVKRFVAETETRINKDKDNIFIFAYGANDSALTISNNSFRISIEDYKENLNKNILEAKKFSNKIFILTATPVVEELTNEPQKDRIRKNEYIKKYNDVITEIVKQYHIKMIDVYSVYIKDDYKDLFCEDGLHPNDKGHELISKIILENILPVL